MQSFAATDVHDIGIRRCDGNRADRTRRLAVEDRIPGAAEVVGLPHAAVHRADVENIGLTGYAGKSACAAATERPNVTPVHLSEHRAVDLLSGGREAGKE